MEKIWEIYHVEVLVRTGIGPIQIENILKNKLKDDLKKVDAQFIGEIKD